MDKYKTCHEIIQPYGFFGSYAIKSCIFQQLAISMTQLIYPVTGKVSFESDLRWNKPFDSEDRFQWNLCWMRLNMQNIFWKMQLHARTVRVVNAHIVWTRGHKLLIAFVRYSNCISVCRYNYPDAVSQRGSAKTNASLVKHKHKLLMTR